MAFQRATFSLAALFSVRMLGLFMILPVFVLYAKQLTGHTAFLTGLALGIYGFTQACFQIPMGWLSDRFGRKPIIFLGFLLFIAGSVIAGLSTHIIGVIVGRALQGMGAVGSVIIALLADVIDDEYRTRAMAMVGLSIAFSFAVAMVLGPSLNGYIGVPGLFGLMALLGSFGLVLLWKGVPTPVTSPFQRDAEAVPSLFKNVLKNPHLLLLDVGIFILHATLIALFIALPPLLQSQYQLPNTAEWKVYLPALIVAFIVMVPFVIVAEKKRRLRAVFRVAICLLMIGVLLLISTHHLWLWALALTLFFTGFTVLEALLPSLVSKIAPAGSKGTAIGVYSTAQFSGIFVGGTLGGWLYGAAGPMPLLGGLFVLLCLWLILSFFMSEPPYLATCSVNLAKIAGVSTEQLALRLRQAPGVVEIYVDDQVGRAYIKFNSALVSQERIQQIVEE